MTFTVSGWQPAGSGSFNDVSETSNYGGRFLANTSLQAVAQAQFEQSAATAGYLRGMLATTQELPVAFFKKDGFSSETFHTNMRAWFSPYETARAAGYLRILWEDGSTLLRIPARVVSLATIPNFPDAYQVVLKAEQPHFEATSETSDSTSTVDNAGNVRCGCEVEFTGAAVANAASGSASGDFTNRLLLVDINQTTANTGRVFVNGVPVPWRDDSAAASHAWVIVNGEDPTIEYVPGFATADPLNDTIACTQLAIAGTSSAYNYDDVRISTLLADARLGGLWRPLVYLPSNWPAPDTGWGYYAEDTTDGFKLYLNDTPSFGSTGDWAFNAVYMDSGGPSITAVTSWDVTLANFTAGEARASLLGRRRGSDVWEELWGSDTNGATTVSVSPTGNVQELMWTIVPATGTLTTDPSLEINPDGASTVTMGAVPSLSITSTAYKRLNGAWTNSTTGQSITFNDFVIRDGASSDIDLHFPARKVDWNIELKQAGLVAGSFELSDPERGIELASGSNTIANTTGGTWTVKHRSGYA